MLNTNMVIPSSPRNMEVLLEAFFNVQTNEHVKAWRWHCYTTGNYIEQPKYSGKLVYGRKA